MDTIRAQRSSAIGANGDSVGRGMFQTFHNPLVGRSRGENLTGEPNRFPTRGKLSLGSRHRPNPQVAVGYRTMISLQQNWPLRLFIAPVRSPSRAGKFDVFLDHLPIL
jgi:hypothetical protein